MLLAIFWILSCLMLLFGVLTIFSRSPINSAMSLVFCFVCLAGLFVTLDAFFIAIIQILVYTGAVMVLFLFIIMLLDIKGEETRRLNLSAWAGGGLVLCGLLTLLVRTVYSDPSFAASKPPLPEGPLNDVALVGETLFRFFNLPFQVIAVLLLVATVGVVMLSRRQLR